MSGKRSIRAPRGSRAQLQGLAPGSCHAHADEQSRSGSRGSAGSIDRLRRHRTGRPKLGMFRCHCSFPCASLKTTRRLLVQSGKPVGKFRTHDEAPRVLIANSNLVGHWSNYEQFNQTRTAWANDVWTDDRRFLDLHRQPGNCAGHIRNLWRSGRKTFRRNPRRQTHRQRRARRNGRRATVGRDHEWRMLHRGRSRSGADREAARYRILRSHGDIRSMKRCDFVDEARKSKARSLGRSGRQLRRRASGNGEAKFRSRFVDRSNQRARRPQRLCPKPNLVSRCHRVAHEESGRIRQALDGSDG